MASRWGTVRNAATAQAAGSPFWQGEFDARLADHVRRLDEVQAAVVGVVALAERVTQLEERVTAVTARQQAALDGAKARWLELEGGIRHAVARRMDDTHNTLIRRARDQLSAVLTPLPPATGLPVLERKAAGLEGVHRHAYIETAFNRLYAWWGAFVLALLVSVIRVSPTLATWLCVPAPLVAYVAEGGTFAHPSQHRHTMLGPSPLPSPSTDGASGTEEGGTSEGGMGRGDGDGGGAYRRPLHTRGATLDALVIPSFHRRASADRRSRASMFHTLHPRSSRPLAGVDGSGGRQGGDASGGGVMVASGRARSNSSTDNLDRGDGGPPPLATSDARPRGGSGGGTVGLLDTTTAGGGVPLRPRGPGGGSVGLAAFTATRRGRPRPAPLTLRITHAAPAASGPPPRAAPPGGEEPKLLSGKVVL